jgi:hypothetical protein
VRCHANYDVAAQLNSSMSSTGRARPHCVATDRTARVVIVQGPAELASWPVEGSDLALVEELARLAVAARRAGYTVRLRDVDSDLARLLGLAGLSEVFGQPEVPEQGGVEEVVVADDPVPPHLDDLDRPR